MSTQTCPDESVLSQLLLGKLTGEQQNTIEAHLETCPECAAKADTMETDDEFVSEFRRLSSVASDLQEMIGSDATRIQDVLDTVQRSMTSEETVWVNETKADPVEPSKVFARKRSSPAELEFLATAHSSDELGRLGHYRVLEVLGSGGMGVVYRAEDPSLKRLVALKAMKPAIAANPEAKQRFLKEAEATAAIEHDNIVTIYQVGEDRGIPFFAMQFLKGESLGSRADTLGRLSQQEVVRIGREIAEGLSAAHARGLIHRDIKPDNIWLQEGTDRVRIVDFGLVRSFEEDAGLTQSGTVLGTPKYMAPEQARGESVDHRCDLFSLGCVLYRLLAGKAPFEGSNLTATLIAVTQNEAAPIESFVPDIKPSLCTLISKLLTKQREGRPESAREVADVLKRIESELAATATPAPETSTSKTSPEHKKSTETATPAKTQPGQSRRPPRNRILIGALGGFAAIILLSVLLIKLRTKDGLVVIELETEQPIAQVEIDGTTVQFQQDPAGKTLSLSVPEGKHSLTLKTAEGLSLTTDLGSKPVEVAVNDKTVVRAWLEPNESKEPTATDSSVAAQDMVMKDPATGQPSNDSQLDNSMLVRWQPGPMPAWAEFRETFILKGDVLPGVVERPAQFAGVQRWNVDTQLPRGIVRVARYSPDGKWLALGSNDGHVRIYDTATMRVQTLLPGSASYMNGADDLSWHPDSSRLAVASNLGTFRVWAINGQLIFEDSVDCRAVAWTFDGSRIICAGANRLDVRNADGSLMRSLLDETDSGAGPGSLSVSPNSLRFACWHRASVRIWNAETFEAEQVLDASDGYSWYGGYSINSLLWGNSDYIAIGLGDRIDVHALNDGRFENQQSFPIAGSKTIAWHPDGKRLTIWDGTISTLNVEEGTLTSATELGYLESAMGPRPTAICWSEDGQYLTLGGGRVRTIDKDLKSIRYDSGSTNLSVSGISLSPEGDRFASACEIGDSGVRIWDTQGKALSFMKLENSNSLPFGTLWHPREDIVLYYGRMQNFGLSIGRIGENLRSVIGESCDSAAWSPDGDAIAVGTTNGSVFVADAEGNILHKLGTGESTAVIVAWSKQNQLFAAVGKKVFQVVGLNATPKLELVTEIPTWITGYNPGIWRVDGSEVCFGPDSHISFLRDTPLVRHAPMPSAWSPDGTRYLQLQQGFSVCSSNGTQEVSVGTNGAHFRVAGAWDPSGDFVYVGYDQNTIDSRDAKNLYVLWSAVILPRSQSMTFDVSGFITDGDRNVLEENFVYYSSDGHGKITMHTPAEFELNSGQELIPIPERYFNAEHRFLVRIGDKWKALPLNTVSVPGIPQAAFARPGGVSLNLFIQETGATIDPAWMLAESAKAQEEKLSATVLEKEVREIAGLDAMWMVVEGMGTGSAIDGKGPVKTTQHWVAIPRESDVVVALLTSPSGTFAENQKLFEEALGTLKLGKAKRSML